MRFLLTGISSIFSGVFGFIFSAGFFKSLVTFFVVTGFFKLIAIAGIGFLTFELSGSLVDFAMSSFSASIDSVSSSSVDFSFIYTALYYLRVGDIFSVILSAYSVVYAIAGLRYFGTMSRASS